MRDSNSFTKLDKCYFFRIIIPLRLWVSSYGGVEIYPRFLFLFNLSSPSPSQLPIFLFLFSLKGPAKSFASSQIGRSIFSIPKNCIVKFGRSRPKASFPSHLNYLVQTQPFPHIECQFKQDTHQRETHYRPPE